MSVVYDPSSAAVNYEASGGKPFVKDGFLFADGLNRRQKRAITSGSYYEELGVEVDMEDGVVEIETMSEEVLEALQEAKKKSRTHTSIGKVKASDKEEKKKEGEEEAKPMFKNMHQARVAEEEFITKQIQKKTKTVVSDAAQALIAPFGPDKRQAAAAPAPAAAAAAEFRGLLNDTVTASLLVADEADTAAGREKDDEAQALLRGRAQEELREIHSSWKSASTAQKQYYNKWFALVFAKGKAVKKPIPRPEPDLEAARRILLDLASKWATLTPSQKDYYHEWYPKVFPGSVSTSPSPSPTPVVEVPTDPMPHGRKVMRLYHKRWSELSREQRVFYNTHYYRYFPNKKRDNTNHQVQVQG
eukprot:TRINITY_DN34306_c0_g1_i1.p1 TRINITY_DN34306_c0_g1~~TRINITY_DN34306_c0_g1_i1.p1  ORF type:complete len:359 (+),score=92.43 TRINITY_DN34306_c0_g1_i1:35-1111(+)